MINLTIQNVAIYLVIINLLTYFIFWQDKRSAINGKWRTSEGTLLFFCAVGGSPAAFYAKRKFRHKTKKKPFKAKYWLIVTLQILALVFFIINKYF